ncbi:hypothetical protein BDZ45DRAFT_416991 [Acephala macrosclerotiorum]|nr:hypothetical protein BDZ45DRAFT_416991 [Acephala macrosclerotiorum]
MAWCCEGKRGIALVGQGPPSHRASCPGCKGGMLTCLREWFKDRSLPPLSNSHPSLLPNSKVRCHVFSHASTDMFHRPFIRTCIFSPLSYFLFQSFHQYVCSQEFSIIALRILEFRKSIFVEARTYQSRTPLRQMNAPKVSSVRGKKTNIAQ